MQVLEGKEEAVQALRTEIGRDPWQRGLMIFLQRPLEERQFPPWSMRFHDLNAAEVLTTPGYRALHH